MRLLITNLLATMLLLLGASVASAVSFNITSNYDGVTPLTVSDTVTVSVFLNTQSELDLVIADVGILFDGGVLQFDESSSSMSSYILYSLPVAGKPPIPSRWMQPLENHINGGTLDFIGGLDATPKLFTGTIPNLVTVGYRTPDFLGTRSSTLNYDGSGGTVIPLATVVFHVIGAGDGLGEIDVTMTSANNVTKIIAGSPVDVTNTVTTSGDFAVITPEPGTAIMVGLGLAGLAVAGKRRRA